MSRSAKRRKTGPRPKTLIKRGFDDPGAALSAWDALRASESTKIKARMPVRLVGLMNAGKSTLANALLGDEKKFQTGDARTTVKVGEARWGDMVLQDTPGLDATADDTAVTESTLDAQGITLFVHALDLGEYQAAEIEFLQGLRETAADLRRQVVPVFTKASQVDNKEGQRLVELCLAMFRKHVGCEPVEEHVTDSVRYFKGTKGDRPRYVELSGINELSAALKRLRDEVRANWTSMSVAQNRCRVEELLSLVSGEQEALAGELANVQNSVARKKKQLRKRLKELNAGLDSLDRLEGMN